MASKILTTALAVFLALCGFAELHAGSIIGEVKFTAPSAQASTH
jgi:hypothetical protein